MIVRYSFVVAFACLLFGSAISVARADEDLTARPGAGGEPTEIWLRIALLDLEEISGANQSFTANFAYIARWRDERLKHDGPEAVRMKLDSIWHPNLQIVNRQRVQETFANEVLVSPDGEIVSIQRVWGNLSQPFELHDFPFDEQTLNIELVGIGHGNGAIVLKQDPEKPSEIADSLSIADWHVEGWVVEMVSVHVAGDTTLVPGFVMSVDVSRNARYHLVNVIIPLVLIIGMSWMVFWINPTNNGPRISVTVTAMLTLVAYRFAVGASLPKIAYLTRMDWFILASSVLVFLSLVQVILTSTLVDRERLPAALKINKIMRVASPIIFLVVGWLSLFG